MTMATLTIDWTKEPAEAFIDSEDTIYKFSREMSDLDTILLHIAQETGTTFPRPSCPGSFTPQGWFAIHRNGKTHLKISIDESGQVEVPA
jgi:hypothetical protein